MVRNAINTLKTRKKLVAFALILVTIVIVAVSRTGGDAPAEEAAAQDIPVVELLSLGSLSQSSEPIVLLGEVRSVSEADLRTQKAGEVTRVNVTTGQFVGAGTLIAEIENSSERASVAQAEGAVAAAAAALAKARAGARAEDVSVLESQKVAAEEGLIESRDGARNAYKQAFTLAEDAILGKTDNFFRRPETLNPSFKPASPTYEQAVTLERERVALGSLLEEWSARANSMNEETNVEALLSSTQEDLTRIKRFVDDVGRFVSTQDTRLGLTQADIDVQEATVLAARTNIDSALSVITGARKTLTNAKSAAEVAALNVEKSQAGERPEDIAAAEASLAQAEASYRAAIATLEKSLIRTPISGTVSSLNITQGDFVNAFVSAAKVVNKNALEVEAFASVDIRKRISVGDSVAIAGEYDGIVVSADPGLDPVTKKARITIGVSDNAALTHGSFVEVLVTQDQEEIEESEVDLSEGIFVPIEAVKVLPRGHAVLVVNEEGILEAVEIEEGAIVGGSMRISNSLTPGMRIVADARGLKPGERVEVGGVPQLEETVTE